MGVSLHDAEVKDKDNYDVYEQKEDAENPPVDGEGNEPGEDDPV